MDQISTVSERPIRDAVVESSADYELIDFGAGRKLERWGQYVVERPDKLVKGESHGKHWQADWVFVAGIGRQSGHWKSAHSPLSCAWSVQIDGQTVLCSLGDRSCVGLHGRDYPCGEWVRQHIKGCYDLDDVRVLNLFGGNGFISAQAINAGASVVHIEASEVMLAQARINAGDESIDYLPHMYGAANYVVIDEVRKLPLKVADIYRRLTT